MQQAPCGVEAVVQQIGLILPDIEVNGVGGAVGQMHIVQALCREGGLQQAPCGVEAVVQQIGLILLEYSR